MSIFGVTNAVRNANKLPKADRVWCLGEVRKFAMVQYHIQIGESQNAENTIAERSRATRRAAVVHASVRILDAIEL